MISMMILESDTCLSYFQFKMIPNTVNVLNFKYLWVKGTYLVSTKSDKPQVVLYQN